MHAGSNILLKLDCTCSSGIECVCPGKGKVTAILSDFDLVEKATTDGTWDTLFHGEPSGTPGMKAPEVFMLYIIILYLESKESLV